MFGSFSPGRYDVGYNETYQLAKLKTLDHYQFYFDVVKYFIGLVVSAVLIYFVFKIIIGLYKTWKAEQDYERMKYQKHISDTFWEIINERLNKFETIIRYMEEDESMDLDSKVKERRRYSFYLDLIEYYKMLIGMEEYIIFKRPHLQKHFEKCREYMAKNKVT